MKLIRIVISWAILLTLKFLAMLFYRFESNWFGEELNDWGEIRVIALLNHTSLFEPLFIGLAPLKFIFKCTPNIVIPGADKTMNRPIVGKFFKFFSPNTVSITRKRDDSWTHFLKNINEKSVVILAPEGRMKRKSGLDLQGNKMTVRGGIWDILKMIPKGKVLIGYSGGLHHVQTPGEKKFRIFKTLKMNFEVFDIESYKDQINKSEGEKKVAAIKDLENRMKKYVPQ